MISHTKLQVRFVQVISISRNVLQFKPHLRIRKITGCFLKMRFKNEIYVRRKNWPIFIYFIRFRIYYVL